MYYYDSRHAHLETSTVLLTLVKLHMLSKYKISIAVFRKSPHRKHGYINLRKCFEIQNLVAVPRRAFQKGPGSFWF
jgi:hypothetical protein